MNEGNSKTIKKGEAYMISYSDGWERVFEQQNYTRCVYVIKRKSFTNFVVTFGIFNKTRVYSNFTIPINNMMTIEKILAEKKDENKELLFLSVIPDESRYCFLKRFGISFSNLEELSSFFTIVKAIQRYHLSN
uniref:GRAM domain-containing protein n=1 Tax=Strongyloides papillosus TaxID=174720 RepID=A0A0N5BLZ4_STREA